MMGLMGPGLEINGPYQKNASIRERVDALKKDAADKPHESPIYDLAKKESDFREELAKENLSKETTNRLADKFSDETLGKLEEEKKRHKAEEESLLDSLTGLKNKRALKGDIVRLLSEAAREDQECSLLLIDFDHFKKINDTHGHQAGDKVLIEISHAIAKSARKSDWFYRIGGEEFVLILPNTNRAGAQALAEKIRECIEETPIKINDQTINITLSIGIASTEQVSGLENNDLNNEEIREVGDELIDKADKALYQSKNSGRNKVTVFEPDKYTDNFCFF